MIYTKPFLRGEMQPFSVSRWTVVILIYLTADGHAIPLQELGMTMAVKSYGIVCWFEKQRIFPFTDSIGFTLDCYYKAEDVMQFVMADQTKMKYFGYFLHKVAMNGLPKEYSEMCTQYLRNPDEEPSSNEGEMLNDESKGKKYPFQAFAYCLMEGLKKRNGPKTEDIVKREKTYQKKPWMAIILDRQNEHRKAHGAQPLQINQDLIIDAQDRAEFTALGCKLLITDPEDRKWKNQISGESSVAGPQMPIEDAALAAANILYEEVRFFPFDEGYKGNGTDELFKKFGHFSQVVWRSTKYVGYGFQQNNKCQDQKWFLVIRYSPSGNYPDEFRNNILPPHY